MPFDLASAQPVGQPADSNTKKSGFDLASAIPVGQKPDEREEKPEDSGLYGWGARGIKQTAPKVVEAVDTALDRAKKYAEDYGSNVKEKFNAVPDEGILKSAAGAGETILNTVTGAFGQLVEGIDRVTPGGTPEGVAEALTYKPRTKTGQAGAELVGAMAQPIGDAAHLAGQGAKAVGFNERISKGIEQLAPFAVGGEALKVVKDSIAERITKRSEETPEAKPTPEVQKQNLEDGLESLFASEAHERSQRLGTTLTEGDLKAAGKSGQEILDIKKAENKIFDNATDEIKKKRNQIHSDNQLILKDKLDELDRDSTGMPEEAIVSKIVRQVVDKDPITQTVSINIKKFDKILDDPKLVSKISQETIDKLRDINEGARDIARPIDKKMFPENSPIRYIIDHFLPHSIKGGALSTGAGVGGSLIGAAIGAPIGLPHVGAWIGGAGALLLKDKIARAQASRKAGMALDTSATTAEITKWLDELNKIELPKEGIQIQPHKEGFGLFEDGRHLGGIVYKSEESAKQAATDLTADRAEVEKSMVGKDAGAAKVRPETAARAERIEKAGKLQERLAAGEFDKASAVPIEDQKFKNKTADEKQRLQDTAREISKLPNTTHEEIVYKNAEEIAAENRAIRDKKRSDLKPSERFIQKIEKNGKIDGADIVLGDSKVSLSTNDFVGEEGKGVFVVSIETPEAARGKGSAQKALDLLIKHADDQGITLSLLPKKYAKGGMSTLKLREWYKKNGFKPSEDSLEMVRPPKKK